MARSLTQSLRRVLPYQTPSRWWHEQSSEPSHFLLKSLPEVKSPGINCVRFISARASAAQTEQSPHVAVSLPSPGYVRDPYSPGERCFTIAGWKRTKEGIISKIKSDYAFAKVRRINEFTEENFEEETAHLYQEISTLLAKGDIKSLRKFVTEKMYSVLKNEIKEREMAVAHVQWELMMPMIKIRPFQVHLIWTDDRNPMKSYAQVTVEFFSEQKFVAFDYDGAVVTGDEDNWVLVREIWVFERSLFHEGAYWRLCGRIKV